MNTFKKIALFLAVPLTAAAVPFERLYSHTLELHFSTFLGGSSWDYADAVAVDSAGDIYVVGRTRSADFPTAKPYQGEKRAGSTGFDAFLSKLSADGQTLLYSTYLGGEGEHVISRAGAIAVDGEGRAVVAGSTQSPSFPTRNPLPGGETLTGGSSAFAARFSAGGESLDFSTYLGGGGSDVARGAAVDEEGNIYVAGHTTSEDFPTVNPFQAARKGEQDGFVAKLAFNENAETLAMVYSTYLGGSGLEELHGLALGSDGSAFVAGETWSVDFPTENPFQPNNKGFSDAFISRISPDGSSLLYSTYLGGEGYDGALAVAAGGGNNIYVAGYTDSTNFPTRDAFMPTRMGGVRDGFVTRFDAGGEPVFSTYFGGDGKDEIRGIEGHARGVFLAGITSSTDFPTVHPYQSGKPSGLGVDDAFASLLKTDGSALIFSTYLGGTKADEARGLAVDHPGRATLAGATRSTDFPLKNAFQTSPGPGVQSWSAFVSKFEFDFPTTTTTTKPTTTTTTTTITTTTITITTTITTTTTTATTTSTTTTAVLPTPSVTPMATATPTASPAVTPMATATPSASPSPTATYPPTPKPVAGGIWYLPAGGTKVEDVVFDTYILIANPGEKDAEVEIRYVGTGGELGTVGPTVAAGTRYTENMADTVGAGQKNVAAIVRSTNDVPIIVERAMYFPSGPANWTGSHNTIGLNTVGTDWFLAEGATHIFDQYVHILNPGTETAEVTVTFFNEIGESWPVTNDNLGGSRVWTVKANDVEGADGQDQLSTRVESRNEVPVAVDRTMYWPKGPGNWADGHATIGVTEFAREWFLPEGATHIFNQYVLVANPSENETATVDFTFTDQHGESWPYRADIDPQRRYTVNVNNEVGFADQVSTRISSDIPVAAERAMYWPVGAPGGWTGGHGTVGVSAPATVWQLPEGATHIFDQYVLVANPGDIPAEVTFIFSDDKGNPWEHKTVVEPGRRYTVKVNDVVGSVAQVSTTVTSNVPVVAERAMYFGTPWKTGHVTVGVPE